VSTTISDAAEPVSRRERNRVETREALANAAFTLAVEHGLQEVRVPDIAGRAGVSPRTFNNYFSSREAAIVWPATQRLTRVAAQLRSRPASEPLIDAIVDSVTAGYRDQAGNENASWIQGFRAMVTAEPTLHGAYLRGTVIAEQELADAISSRPDAPRTELDGQIIAGIVTAAERAAIRHWMTSHTARHPARLETVIAKAIRFALGPH
jgi:AcrR family transcriptional regulator